MRQIRTEAFIPAPPDKVWAVLADFERYAEWNPLNVKASGEARPGAKIRMTFLNLARSGGTIDQTVTLTTCEPGRALAWSGAVPLLFRGRHHFTLASEGEGTRLLHGEDLAGLIPMTFSRAQIARDFVPAYEATNRALADRVAALA
ncbi:MAG TPA: SRPBCC domain-containing protein [Phenylobacterium sp.]|nr:SRPBCC domain-containing protein [Phenylobacterium sp.]